MSKLPRLLQLLLVLVAFYLIPMTLSRIAFWGYFSDANNPLPSAELLNAFYVGFKFDLRLTLYILLPLFLLGGIKWLNPYFNKLTRSFWLTYLALMFAGLILFYIFDFGYFSYLQKPMDATILRFYDDLAISMSMMWQSYPVITLISGLVAISVFFAYLLYRIFKRFEKYQPVQRSRIMKTTIAVVSFFIVLFGMYGKFSYYPLRWSDAFTSTHTFAPPLTLNPVLYFFNTMKNKSITYSEEKTRHYYDVMADYLGVTDKSSTTLNFTREITQAGPLAAAKPNIVMVFLESFAAYKTTTFGNPMNPTPHFDELARNGLLFTRFYTPHTGTARSVFAAITSMPDIELNKTSTRNPLIVDQHTLVNAFKDYEKFYFLGGSANWGNIRGVLSHNIPGLHIYEEGSYKAERVDVWGISDLHLFDEANQVLKQQQKPFFAIIQTAGNHRPYTIPEDNRGFVFDNQSDEELKQHGFSSNGEYNSFRYMDHSVGFFMQQAKKAGYFDNTIFVFFGDHGISGFGGNHRPAYETHYDLTGLHVPFVIYAPKLITQPRRFNKLASEVDMLATIAGLASNGYKATTLGRDLLDEKFDKQRYAFTITHFKIPELSLIGQDFMFRMRADGTSKALYDTRGDNFEINIIAQQPKIAQQMEQICLGMYETAKYMRHHNPNADAH